MASTHLCCGCAALDPGTSYDLGLHVGAIFIMFGVSVAGTLVPFVAKRLQSDPDAKPVVMEVFFAFSFGIVMACGLIHMINEGVERLKNPCLGSITESYGALGLAVVLATLVALHFIECESAVYLMGRDTQSSSKTTLGDLHSHPHPHGHGHGHGHGHDHGHLHAREHSECSGVIVVTPDPTLASTCNELSESPYSQVTTSSDKQEQFADPQARRAALRQKIAALIFEMGVIFHSVIIGLDLGVTTGDEFMPLFVAICFHQFFEGVAIGGSTLRSIESRRRLVLLNLTFALMTPIGLAFGIAVRTTYSASSVTALWVNGVLDCVAGGILLYNGLVELMTYNMTTNEEFLSRPTRQRFAIYAALWLGAGAMAFIGKWA